MVSNGDWLFGFQTDCSSDRNNWDTDISNVVTQIMLMWLLAVSGGFIILLGTRCQDPVLAFRISAQQNKDENERTIPRSRSDVVCVEVETRKPTEYLYHLDYARIICVACVVAEHAGSAGAQYSRNNAAFVLQWVMQFLFIVSGMAAALSRSPLWQYVLRLTIVFAIGLGFNIAGMEIAGIAWTRDIGNTIYQMFYVGFLIVLAFVAGPLRYSLKERLARPLTKPSIGIMLYTAVLGILVCFGIVLIYLDKEEFENIFEFMSWLPKNVFGDVANILSVTGGVLFLAALGSMFPPNPYLAWVLLLIIYYQSVFLPYQYVNFPHNVELYTWGIIIQLWGFAGKESIKNFLRSYWPLVFCLIMLLNTPDVHGRCDYYPAQSWWVRFRFYFIEFILIITFASGVLNTTDPLKVTSWLNVWALFAYVSHMFWWRSFGNPWGPLASWGSAVIFYLLNLFARSRRRRKQEGEFSDDGVPVSIERTLTLVADGVGDAIEQAQCLRVDGSCANELPGGFQEGRGGDRQTPSQTE